MPWSLCLAEGKEEKKNNNPFMSHWYYIWDCTRKDKTVWTWKAIYWRRQFGVCRSSGLCTPNSEMPSYQLTTWNDKTLMPNLMVGNLWIINPNRAGPFFILPGVSFLKIKGEFWTAGESKLFHSYMNASIIWTPSMAQTLLCIGLSKFTCDISFNLHYNSM